jgi:hypothetical protein
LVSIVSSLSHADARVIRGVLIGDSADPQPIHAEKNEMEAKHKMFAFIPPLKDVEFPAHNVKSVFFKHFKLFRGMLSELYRAQLDFFLFF